jgi:hypothetical protein
MWKTSGMVTFVTLKMAHSFFNRAQPFRHFPLAVSKKAQLLPSPRAALTLSPASEL